MAKLSIDDKREIIKLHERGETISKICRQYNVNDHTVYLLLRKYSIHGDKVFEKSYHSYPADYKLQIVNRLIAGETVTSLACEYNLEMSVVSSWLERYRKNGYNGLIDKAKGRPTTMKNKTQKTYDDPRDKEIDELKQKNLELEAEVEGLKKLRALVLQRNAQQLKKKQ